MSNSNKFYIQFDSNGKLVTRFDDHKSYLPHPIGTVEVEESLWQQTMQETDGVWMRDTGTGDITKQPFPPPSLDELRVQRKAEIETEASELISVQTGETIEDKILMLADMVDMIDEQAGRGGQRNPRQDTLRGRFGYVKDVKVNLGIALEDLKTSDDPSAVTLVHPTLP